MANLPRVLVVGGGFGGFTAAKQMRNFPVDLTVVDQNNHHLFQPLLYQVATAGLAPSNIAMPIRTLSHHQNRMEVLMAEVIGVDTKKKQVLTATRQLPYDYLVLATGAHYNYFGHEEWKTVAPGLKSLQDAIRIRKNILSAFEKAEVELDEGARKAYLTFVIVGGGPTGVELAGSIAELSHRSLKDEYRHIDPVSTRILLVEAGPRILSGFSESLSRSAHRELEKLGVEVKTGSPVEKIDVSGVVVSGNRIEAKTVIWAAGVRGSKAGVWLQAPMDRTGKVEVLPDLSVPGHPEIFVIGDTALVNQDGQPLPGVAPVAMQQGRYVARVIRSRIAGVNNVPAFHYFDKGNLATVGRAFAIVEFRKIKASGWIAWMIWLLVHIYYLIGFRNRVLVLIEWAWAYLTFKRGARIIPSNV